MKLISLLVLAFFVAGCGQSGSSKTKPKSKSMEQLNDTLLSLGVKVVKMTIPTAIGEHIVVGCVDSLTTDLNANNYDRATALQAYKDAMNGMDQVEFGDRTRVDIWKVEWAVDSAITLLETKLTEKACPDVILGKQKI